MMDVKVSFEAPGISLRSTTVDAVAKWVGDQHQAFTRAVGLTHRKSVFQILNFLIRICPVDTGRLRGSWTPFFDKYGNASYQKWLQSEGMASYPRVTPKKGFSRAAAEAGKAEGMFIDQPLRTTVASNVKYAEYADARVGFMARTVGWGQQRYNSNFEALLAKAQEAGMIPAVNPNEETTL